MLAQKLGILCSRRCELVIAMSYVKARDEMVEIAHRLAADESGAPVRLANRLDALPRDEGAELAEQTLRGAGIGIG